MVFFLKFKSSETYRLYRRKVLEEWEQMVWKLGFLLILIEVCRIIEDSKHEPYNLWEYLWKIKVLNIGYYIGVTYFRLLVVKLLRRVSFKQYFLNITDIAVVVSFVIILDNNDKFPDPGSLDYHPIWIGKEYLRLYAGIFCLCFAFYNWFTPVLYIGAYFGYVCYLYVTLIPGYEWIFFPSYVTAFICLFLLCFSLERIRRTSFEENYESHQKEKVYREILNEFPEGTLIINQKKEVLYVNHSFYQILNMNFQNGMEEIHEITDIKDISIEGYSTDSSTFGNVSHPITKFRELQDEIWSKWSFYIDYFSSNQPHDDYKMFKGVYQIDEERSKTIEIKFTLRNFGGENVALFIFSDVSERLLVSYLKQSIEYKNRLLASVSHELRTPLNGNINFIQAAINDPSVPNQIKESRLTPALRSARYLLILINDILDFSQIQAQSLRLVPVSKDIVETVKEAMELVEIQAQRKGLSLMLNLAQLNWHHELKTDHNRVLQIIANLLSNALKFTFSGGITVSVRPEGHKVVIIEVEDTGIGIKKEDQPKLFRAFGKLDLGGKNYINSQGVGLGLIISNSLACMLGPQTEILDPRYSLEEERERLGIHFQSEYGRGTKFWFRIVDQDDMKSNSHCGVVASEGNKINDVPEFTTTNANVPLLSQSNSCQCPEFLIADDDAFNILTLESMIVSIGMSSGCAYNGAQVLEMIMKRINNPCCDTCQPYKMIFLDCNMPIMDGYECMTKLKALFSSYPEFECPVIACTAAAHQAERDKALECGMKDFVTKPINKVRIQELVNMYCSKNNSSGEKFEFLSP